ncbi:hypothetical protein BN2497_813 [Janthinobacterium sp. CG23_2]|nr:hypothetical protein BN2497_813 [Janthinobacterium sp. CG23_2]CUU26804.1 hypothetical protein BN3177_813 [Janthinobacterium sp. CG23_2]
MVRGGGLEPPHHCWRQDLNLVRLPISPSSRDRIDRHHRQVNAPFHLKKQRAPDSETGRPALPLLGATTSTRYFTGFSDHIGRFLKRAQAAYNLETFSVL